MSTQCESDKIAIASSLISSSKAINKLDVKKERCELRILSKYELQIDDCEECES
jgi:hypothetical protein